MNVLMVRAKVKAEHVAEVEAVGKRIFEALEREQPQGFRYTTCRLPDGVTYVNLWEIDDGVDNPLSTLPEARAFQEGLKTWMTEPPIYEQLTVVGSYRFF
jgi:quinol monooxygenase YgiN